MRNAERMGKGLQAPFKELYFLSFNRWLSYLETEKVSPTDDEKGIIFHFNMRHTVIMAAIGSIIYILE